MTSVVSCSPPGPSTAIDTACSSSLLALENAFHAIRQGQCDAALVGGVNLLLKPNTSVQFMKLGMLSPDGTCKSFDSSGEIKILAVPSSILGSAANDVFLIGVGGIATITVASPTVFSLLICFVQLIHYHTVYPV